MSSSPKTDAQLADEAATCIEDSDLRGEPLRAYLAAFITECATAGDLDALRAQRPEADARLERALRES